MGDGEFISGIYKYCDRWCERCRATARCEVYFRERQRRILPRDFQFPDDAQEEVPAPAARVDIASDPLHMEAHRLAMKMHGFLDRFSLALHDERRQKGDGDRLVALQDGFEILSWYHFQIPVKVDRALQAWKRSQADDAELARMRKEDSEGNSKVAYSGLSQSMDVLVRLHALLTSYQSEIMPLLDGVTKLMESLDQRFPGHRTFIRAGLDD